MGPRVSGRGRGATGGGLAALLLVMELKLRPLEARPPPAPLSKVREFKRELIVT